METSAQSDDKGKPRTWTRYLPLAALVIAMIAVFASGGHRFLTVETIVAYRERLQAFVDDHGAAAVIGYSALYVAVVALSIPGAAILSILGGFLFGWFFGGALAAVSATLGGIVLFLVARTSVGDMLMRRAGPRLQSLAEGFHKDAFSYLLFLRILPIMPFWLTNLACALFGVRPKTFALATLIGVLPASFTFGTAGAGLDSVIGAQKASFEACQAAGRSDCTLSFGLRSVLTPEIIGALAALGVLSLIPVAIRRFRRSKAVGASPAA